MNLWHDISKGEKIPEEFNCIIEIPKGSHNKYEIDKETGLIKLDRANFGSSPYPFDYGYIPQTLWDDGDALDVILLSTYPVNTGVLVNARPVGLMEVTDTGESDFKILAVPTEDQRWDDVQDIKDVNKHSLKEFTDFWQNIKNLKPKVATVTVDGIKGKKEAMEAISRSIELYNSKFGK